MTSQEPRPFTTREINGDFARAVRNYHKFRWRITVAALVILAAAVAALGLWSAEAQERSDARVAASCKFLGDRAAVPVIVTPPARRPPESVVLVIADARNAWQSFGCPGRLPSADRSFLYWASVYRIPVR